MRNENESLPVHEHRINLATMMIGYLTSGLPEMSNPDETDRIMVTYQELDHQLRQ